MRVNKAYTDIQANLQAWLGLQYDRRHRITNHVRYRMEHMFIATVTCKSCSACIKITCSLSGHTRGHEEYHNHR